MYRNNNRMGWLIGLSCLGGCILCFGLVMVAGVIWIARNMQHEDRHRSAGNAYYNEGQYQRAITEYSLVIESSPEEPEGYFRRGLAYYALRNYDRSIADDTTALSLADGHTLFSSPESAEYIADLYYNRGLNYYVKRDNPHALADFSRAISGNPQDANAYEYRGKIYEATQKYDMALSDYSQAIRTDPTDSDATLARADLYLYLKRYAESGADYTRVTQLTPGESRAWGNLGWVQFVKGDLTGAVRNTKKALQLDPKLFYARYNLGLCYAVQNDWASARQEYEKALQSSKPKDIKVGLNDIQNALRTYRGSSGLKQAQALLQSALHHA